VHLVLGGLQFGAAVVQENIVHGSLLHEAQILGSEKGALLVYFVRIRDVDPLLLVELSQLQTQCILDALLPECYGVLEIRDAWSTYVPRQAVVSGVLRIGNL